MSDALSIIKEILQNEITRALIIYYFIGVGIWFIFFFMLMRESKSSQRKSSNNSAFNKRLIFLYLSSATLLFSLLFNALNYAGFLPYGPDTAIYTYYAKKISSSGRWSGSKGYYKPFHTSAVLFAIVYQVVGSMELAYILLLMLFLLSLTLLPGLCISRMLRPRLPWLGMSIVTLLFTASPNLGGFDLLQQYISMVYAMIAISILIAPISNSRVKSCIFMLVISLSIITHLTSVLLSTLLLSIYISTRKENFRFNFMFFVTFAITYLFYFVDPNNIVLSLCNVLESLISGTLREYTIRALTEVEASRIFLVSWTLLPSISSAFILLNLVSRIWQKKTVNPSFDITGSEGAFHKFILISFLFSLLTLLVGVLTPMTRGPISRYFDLPAYTMLLYAVSLLLYMILRSAGKRMFILMTLLLIILSPYIYSATNSDARSPWMGGTRLAPVTRKDRMEMLFLVYYGKEGSYLYKWHDVYVPIEIEDLKETLTFISGGSYYPIYDILLKATKGEKVNIPLNSYLIPHRSVLANEKCENYNIIFSGCEHVILIPLP
ncbi:MAG: hypothetical protein QXX41_06285 [Nitrososphaerota archaeon]